MSFWSRPALLGALVLAALMVVPAGVAVASHPPSALAASSMAPASSGAHPLAALASPTARADASVVARTMDLVKDGKVAKSDVFLPNLNVQPPRASGAVHPLYTAAPAPMGLSDIGVRDVNGRNVGTVSYTSSVEGTFQLNSVDPFYLLSSSPDWFTVQLNTVATHVDVLNNTSGTFWIQNVPVYQASTQTLSFENNIWNFTAPGAAMQSSTLYSYDGYLFPGSYYYAPGPSFHMPTPFTVRLYNNATVFNYRPTIFFNYSITAANGTVLTGSYDQVEFNSSVTAGPTNVAPRPTYQINGKQYNAFGLLNDAEIMLGGPGGGSTTTLLSINGSMGLFLKGNGTGMYSSIPSAYDFGTDTGETSEGIAEWTPGPSSPVAMLGSGPSLLYPLWGLVGAHAGSIHESFTVAPSNAFVFASTGTRFDVDTAAWAPGNPTGSYDFVLSPGAYTFQFLLADHQPRSMTTHTGTSASVVLAKDLALGVYTPLYAWSNAQLPGISSQGKGTHHNPFVLDHNVPSLLNPLFGEFNDYEYPVFQGIFLGNTNAYVTATGLTDFPIAYSLAPEALATATFFGTPVSNYLQLQFYNASHVSLVYNSQLTGWFATYTSYAASVEFWNSSDNLIGGNQFQVDSTGLILFGGTNNVVWGNSFAPATPAAKNPGSVLNTNFQQSLQIYDSGDLIYNNMVTTYIPAYTPTFNLYSGAPSVWTDRWNVTPQPASVGHMVNGWNLSGSILGLATQSGNFWGNYGSAGNPYGSVPYDDYGLITVGGDSHPLLSFQLFKVTFTETGLPTGTAWSVTLNGITAYGNTSISPSLSFWDPNGTFVYMVGNVTGYTAHPTYGAELVSGANTHRTIRWT
jgi:thermopsin